MRQRVNANDAPSVFERHNLVVAYIAIGLSVSMAFRDVRTPITDLSLIDPETGFVAVQEKDRADGAHARAVWIPQLLRDVAEDYLAYLRGLWTRLLDIPTFLVVKPTKARDKRLFGKAAFKLSLLRTLFFFERQEEGGWQAVEFTGTRLMELLATVHPGWPIPNAGRHFAGTRSFNWSPDSASAPESDSLSGFAVINKALLGHWHLGESAWMPNSGFDPYRYREAIQPVIEAIIADIDFQRISL